MVVTRMNAAARSSKARPITLGPTISQSRERRTCRGLAREILRHAIGLVPSLRDVRVVDVHVPNLGLALVGHYFTTSPSIYAGAPPMWSVDTSGTTPTGISILTASVMEEATPSLFTVVWVLKSPIPLAISMVMSCC